MNHVRTFRLRHRVMDEDRLHGFWRSQLINLQWLTFYGPRLLLWQLLYSVGLLDAPSGAFIYYRLWPSYARWPSRTWRARHDGSRGDYLVDAVPWRFVLRHGLHLPVRWKRP